jgi:hypothetical protein
LKSDFQYSVKLVYNNFPWPNPTPEQRTKIEEKAKAVLTVRENHLPPRGLSTLADLYDPLTMPAALANAHADLDRAVEKCYRPEAFRGDRERVEFLFNLYADLTTPLLPLPVTRKRRGRKEQGVEPESNYASDDESESAQKPSSLPKWYHDAFQPQPKQRGEIVTDSLDVIYDQLDDMLCAGKFVACNRFLAAVIREPEQRDLSVLIGILTITLGAARKLPNRAKLRELVHRRLVATGQNADAALKGL